MVQRATKNVQLMLQNDLNSNVAPFTTHEKNLILLQDMHDRTWAVKRTKWLFHLSCSNAAKKIVRFLLPVLLSLKILKSTFTIPFFVTRHIAALALQLRL